MVEEFEYLSDALNDYLVKAGEKMRRQKLSANAVTVFLATNRFSKTEQYSNSLTFELANPSNSTR
jgi:DNA polymerase V